MKRKRFVAMLVSILLCSSCLMTSSLAANSVQVMYEEDIVKLWDLYDEELELIEQEMDVDLSDLDREDIKVIVQEVSTTYHGVETFETMLGEIAVACSNYRLLTSPGANRRGQGRIENLRTTVLYGPNYLTGKIITCLGTGDTEEGSFTFSIGAGTEIKGFTIESSISFTSGYSYSGPSHGLTLGNGLLVTDVYKIEVCYGTVIYQEYDYVDNESGQRFPMSAVIIDEETAEYEDFSLLTTKTSSSIYIQHASIQSRVFLYANEDAFAEELSHNPTKFF